MTKKSSCRLVLMLAAITLSLASCNEEQDSTGYENIPMMFTCSTAEHTRATTYDDYTGGNFGVQATNYTGNYTSTTGKVHMDNVEVTYSDGTCSTAIDYFWPDGDMHFAAYSPYVEDPSTSDMQVTLPQKPYAGYSYNGKVEGRTNLMFANEQYGSLVGKFTTGSVPIQFNHALTKVTFSVKLSDAQDGNVKLNVKSLSLDNIRYNGNVNFTHDEKELAKGKRNEWVASNEDNVWNTEESLLKSEDKEDYLKAVTINLTKLNEITDEEVHTLNDCLYLMPQILYRSGESEFVQIVKIEYALTINGTTTEYEKSLPLYRSDISKWTINKHANYQINIMPPGGTATLDVAVQPWNLEEISNEFSNIVTIDDEEKDIIIWAEGTYNSKTVTDEKNELIIKPDINVNAEFTFKIGHPLGATWYAILRTISGNPSAFKLVALEGASIVDGTAVGAVGDRVKLAIQAVDPNPTEANKAELYFVVRCDGQILPVDILTTNKKNFVIIQNINI